MIWLLLPWAEGQAAPVFDAEYAEISDGGDEVPVEDEVPAEVVVTSAPRGSASERHLDAVQLQATPGRTVDQQLRAVPGLHVSAHGGRGKALQFFLRGFDAVHGADLSVRLDGVPLNEVSNTHGHGYLDLGFVPSLLLSDLVARPGTWRAQDGDFATAGSVELGLGLTRPGGMVRVGGGTDRSGQLTVAWRPETRDRGTFVVADADLGLGVGEGRSARQLRVGAGLSGTVGAARVRGWILGYDGAFRSPGVLRESDLLSSRIGYYEAYPGAGRGRSSRVLGAVSAVGGTGKSSWRVSAYSGIRAFRLDQNFTGWYADPEHGDGERQEYRAWTSGLRGGWGWIPTEWMRVRAGIDLRVDRVLQAQQGLDAEGALWGTSEDVAGILGDTAGWADVTFSVPRVLEATAGLRGVGLFARRRGDGGAAVPVLAPKGSVHVFPGRVFQGFLAYGRGFRSSDLGAMSVGDALPVATVHATEVGVRVGEGCVVEGRVVGFATWVSDEVLFDHLALRYLTSGSTRRVGLDAGVLVRPLEGMRVGFDLTWTDGRYRATGDPIPYAPRWLPVVTVASDAMEIGPVELTAGIRGWLLGPRPLPNGFSSRTTGSADLTATMGWSGWTVDLDVDNVLGMPWRDGEFQFPSWWDRDTPRSELPVRHITVGAPLAARVALGRRF